MSSKTDYSCEFIEICSDINKLKESNWSDEDLLDQYNELCSIGGFKCLIKEELSKRSLENHRDILLAEHVLIGGVLEP